MYKISAKVFYI